MDGWMEVLLICHISFCHFLREFLYNAICNPQWENPAPIKSSWREWWPFKNTGICSRILGNGTVLCMNLYDTQWYSRSEDLSELILVRDIRDAIVRPPISQGKAPKWHGGIHLKKNKKKQQTKTHIWGKAKTTLLDNRHMMKGLLSSMASMLKRKRGTDETLWKPSVVEVKHHGSATTESFRKILTIPDRHNWVNFSKNVCFNAPGFLVACQACQQTLSYPLSFYLLC